ncbi:MAG: RNA polymerase sigma factor [Bdellovibrionota bacterium]
MKEAEAEVTPPVRPPAAPLDHFVQTYGDLLFDLSEAVLWNPLSAQLAFRSILKSIRSGRKRNAFETHERAWVLQIACERILGMVSRHARRVTIEELIELDAHGTVPARMKKFDAYFHRLPAQDQLLLLLKDKHGLPWSEIASALRSPEGSLKVRRQQALRTLEEWLWDAK